MEEKFLEKLEEGTVVCSICGLVIPLTFKKGPNYTCPSFTFIEDRPVCYRDYRPEDYK